MAISKSAAEFDNLLVKNKDTFLKNRGSKSPFAPIEAPVGPYYARLLSSTRDVEQVDQKDQNGRKTGFKVPMLRVRHLWSFVASADPQCPPNERERWAGQQVYQNYRLHDDASFQRYYGDLEQIGVDTNGLVLSETEIQDPENQYTIGQVCTFLTEQKPFGKVSLTQGDPTKGDAKFVNYRGSILQSELEQILGHPVEDNPQSVQEETYEQIDDGQAPFESNGAEGGAEPELVWVEDYGLFKDTANPGDWYDKDGNQVEDPTVPKTPVVPKVQKPQVRKPTPAAEAPKPAPARPTRPMKPGMRK